MQGSGRRWRGRVPFALISPDMKLIAPQLAGPPQSRLWHLSNIVRGGFKAIYVAHLACQNLHVSLS